MAYTDINSEDRLVQATFANHLENALGWDSVYAWNQETFGPTGTLGRAHEREVVLVRDLREALIRLNPQLPTAAINEAVTKLTHHDHARSLPQHNQAFYQLMRDGVPVSYRDAQGQLRHAQAAVIDFRTASNNRFLAVRELKITGLRTPNYNRRADLVCFINGLPVVFIELKAVYKNIRAGFDGNLRDYLDDNVIAHAFHHNAFLIVSNGDKARYGSITSTWEHFNEWKRLHEQDKGNVAAEVLLNGMLDKVRLLDIIENFILFDASKAGAVRKVVARNHQLLGVNQAVAAVVRQEALKRQFPVGERLTHRVIELPLPGVGEAANESWAAYPEAAELLPGYEVISEAVPPPQTIEIVERAHPDLGRLGVVWHTQGSGKSYSMAFFAEKVRRTVEGNFTFVLMTDRDDLDSQIYKTFVGCSVAGDQTPRAGNGKELEQLLKQNHRYVFSLIHKFNQAVKPDAPYSDRDDIIVISDEAHRTQSGKLARNMRLALPNAAFIGFTGTPLFKHDELTKRIFGGYVSRYDFKRSEEDGATVKLVYENRGEKLGLARLDLNEKIAAAVDAADLDPDQNALLEKLLGKDYEVITADPRLAKVAADFVEHCSTRWEAGKAMLVCIDKITCARMLMLIEPAWKAKAAMVRALADAKLVDIAAATDDENRQVLHAQRDRLLAKADWMDETILEIIISEAQNEVADFKKWGCDIIPHRARMKLGFETADGKRVDVETAFKNPKHPFRVAIVCAMWLTGFDVECLSTLYIDKPMRAHTLMQAIARANRVYPGKDFGLIVDYNGMLKSLREALAQYALGDDGGEADIVVPIEERVAALQDAIAVAEAHLQGLGFDPATLLRAKGFGRIQGLADAVEAVYTDDESKRRFEILSRVVFGRFKALLAEPSALAYAERHDNLEAIYKKLSERRDTADVTELLKVLHRIVNQAIATQGPGVDQAEGLTIDLTQINMEKLRDEFARKVKRKATAIEDIRQIVEDKLAQMLALNPLRMNYEKKYQEIIAAYNQDKDRATIEDTFAKLMDLANGIDAEQRRALEEGLSEAQLALFDLLLRDNLTKAERDRIKQASRELLAGVLKVIAPLDHWTEKEQTQAEVETFILDSVYQELPDPPYTSEDKQALAALVYRHIWQQSVNDQSAQR
ncbi:MAG: type I restriction endonuclease subunit R [Aquabacterium sp.]|uniref:type I restriction endonuclease subunit R n=1 Tax=Aquabacterium sp. TaxID=1872578 RepID=UPI002727470B|nr:type I restriction endonuclease subunit R [Aquabacterium sp.]MDO9005642.1 type I restriction endonuclease subunit R [Aquabacterium sp.]